MEYKDFDEYKNSLEGWKKVIPTIEMFTDDYGDTFELVTETTEVYEFEKYADFNEKIKQTATLEKCKKIYKKHDDEKEIKSGPLKGETVPEKWTLTVVMEHN